MKLFARSLALLAALCVGAFFLAEPATATLATLMSTQNADNVAITGGTISGVTISGATIGGAAAITSGTINGAVIGGTTPAAGTFTTEQAATLLGGGTTANNASLKAATVASAVNMVTISGSATGAAPTIGISGASADANQNIGIAGNGTGIVLLGQALCTAAGATPQTCNGQRGLTTTGTLTTAAATASTYVINDSSVTTSSVVQCTLQGYSGTYLTNGTPIILDCKAGAGTITVDFANLHATNALNGTLKFGFLVTN